MLINDKMFVQLTINDAVMTFIWFKRFGDDIKIKLWYFLPQFQVSKDVNSIYHHVGRYL